MNPFAWAALGQGASAYTEAMQQLEDRKLRKQQQDIENQRAGEEIQIRQQAAVRAAAASIREQEQWERERDQPLIDAYKSETARALQARETDNNAQYDDAAAQMTQIHAKMAPATQRYVRDLMGKFEPIRPSPTPEESLGLLGQGASLYKAGVVEPAITPLLRKGGVQLPGAQPAPYVSPPTPSLAPQRSLGMAGMAPQGPPTLTLPTGLVPPPAMEEPSIFGPVPATEAQILAAQHKAEAAEYKAKADESKAKAQALTRLRLEGNDLRKTITEAYERPANVKTVDADTLADRQRLYAIVRYKLPLNDPDATPDKPMPAGWGRRGALAVYQERSLNIQEKYYGLAKMRETRMDEAQSFDQAMQVWRGQVDAGQFDYKMYRDGVRDAQWNAEQEYEQTQDAEALYRRKAELRYHITADVKAKAVDQATADALIKSLDQLPAESTYKNIGTPPVGTMPGPLPPMPGIQPFRFGDFGPTSAKRGRPKSTGVTRLPSGGANVEAEAARKLEVAIKKRTRIKIGNLEGSLEEYRNTRRRRGVSAKQIVDDARRFGVRL